MLVYLTPYLLKLAFFLTLLLIVKVTIRKYLAAKLLLKHYYESLDAIKFLLGVEDAHCQNNKENHGASYRTTMRKQAAFEKNIIWTGKFSRSNIEKKQRKLHDVHTSIVAPLDKVHGQVLFGLLK